MKNAVITGGSRGIGFVVADFFAKKGYNIFLGARTESTLVASVKKLKKTHPHISVEFCTSDFTKEKDIQAFYDSFYNKFSHCDLLVNNVGTFFPDNETNITPLTVEKLLQTNFFAAVGVTTIFLSQFLKQNFGHIVMINSIATKKFRENTLSYSISKSALEHYSRALTKKVSDTNIKITSLYPDAVETESWNEEEKKQGIHFLKAEKIAEAIEHVTVLPKMPSFHEIILEAK